MSAFTNWKELYCYLLVFLLIYLEWGYDPVIAQNIPGLIKTALIIIIVIPLFFFKSFSLKLKSTGLFFYLACVIILRALGDVQIESSILLFVPIFSAFIITCTYSFEKLLNAFCNIITFLAAYSLIVYVTACVLPSVISSFPVLPNVFNTPIHNLGLAVIPSGVSVIRNYGIAWEPGAFALLLCLAIYGQIVAYKTLNNHN